MRTFKNRASTYSIIAITLVWKLGDQFDKILWFQGFNG